MERRNTRRCLSNAITGSPPQIIPVRDTGLYYTTPNRLVRGKSSSIVTRPTERTRTRYSVPPFPALKLTDRTERSFANLNENQNSAFATYLNMCENQSRNNVDEDDSLTLGGRTLREKQCVSVADCLFNMWQGQKICDVVLRVNGQDFPAHRLAIAAHSQSFSSKFCAAKKTADVCNIAIPNSTLDAAREVLKYIYTSEVKLDMQNLCPILSCAMHLGITALVEKCTQMLHNPTIDNALDIMTITRQYEMLNVFATTYNFVCQNFTKVSQSDSFLEMSYTDLVRLLRDDNLKVDKELYVFFAAMKWLEFNRQERLGFTKVVLCAVRFVHISPEEIATHVEPKMSHSPEFKDLLIDVFRFHALKFSGSSLLSPFHTLPLRKFQPRQLKAGMSAAEEATSIYSKSTPRKVATPPNPNTPVIIAAGGVDPFIPTSDNDASSRLLTEYNPTSNTWNILTSMPDARHHHGIVALDKQIYVIGGSLVDSTDPGNLSNPTDNCYRYDTIRKSWANISSMLHKRMYHGVVVLGRIVYAIGGQDEREQTLSSAEFYNPDTNIWGEIPPMEEAKIGVAVASHRGTLYVVGGFVETDQVKAVMGTVEFYDPRMNRWDARSSLPSPRCHAGLVDVRGTLFLIGGSTFYDDSDAISSLGAVLRLDDDQGHWDLVNTLSVPRHDAGIAVIGDHIYVIGGVTSSDDQALANVEVLDVSSNRWLEGVDCLLHGALGLACCSLNANEN